MTSVIMLVNEFPPLPAGGAEKQAERLSVYMASRGARVKVLTRAGGQLPAHERRNGFEIERIAAQGPHKLGTILFTFGTMLALFRQRKTYQVLHAHLAFAPAVAAALIGRLLNKKVIVKFGNSGSFGDIQVSQNSFLGRLKLAMLRRWVDANVVLDEIMEAELLNAGFNRQRVIRMVNGIDTTAFSRRNEQGVAKSMLGIANKTVLLFVGRLVPQKALPDLLIALNLLLKTHPNLHLFLLGKGEEQLHLEQQAQALGISEHITFTGNVDDVQPYLDAADLFVLPSLAEGISNALLEAMTAGLPCVATSVGGTPEVLANGTCGVLVPPSAPEALAAGIGKLIDQPSELTRLGLAARDRIRQHYALPIAGDRYLELYSRLISKEQASAVSGSSISVADTEAPSS